MLATSPKRCRAYACFVSAVGGVLIVAAVLKGRQLAFHESVGTASSPLLVVLEFVFGLWLITGLNRSITRLVAMVCFFGLMEAALWLGLTGATSCGCLGQVEFDPWYAFVADAVILVGLALASDSGEEMSIRTHPVRFCAFVIIALAVGAPGMITMVGYQREDSVYSYDLRHDPLLHSTKILVELREPTARALMALVARRTGADLSVDHGLKAHFASSRPRWESINNRTQRAWSLLEAISKTMPVPSRWLKTRDGYVLIADNPLRRAWPYWATAVQLAGIALLALHRNGSRIRPVAERAADTLGAVASRRSGNRACY